jgi:WD40 repeat protein
VLFGVSGLGKTSLLRAGLFPRLRALGHLPVWIRLPLPAQHAGSLLDVVQQRLEEAAEAAGLELDVRRPQESLWEYLNRFPCWQGESRLVVPVLVFDQFEEVVSRYRTHPEAAAFLHELADLVEGRVPLSLRLRPSFRAPERGNLDPVKVLLSLREDHLAELESLRIRMPSVDSNRLRLLPLTGADALRIVRTLGAGGVLERGELAREIVRFAALPSETQEASQELEDLRVEPLLLSLAGAYVAETQASRPGSTTSMHLPPRAAMVRKFLDDALAAVARSAGPGAREACVRVIEERLVDADGRRTLYSFENARREAPEAALTQLVEAHALRRSLWSGQPHLELIHDRLAETVAERRRQRRESEARAAEVEATRLELLAVHRRRRWFGIGVMGLVAAAIGAVAIVTRVENADLALASSRASAAQHQAEAKEERTARTLAETEALRQEAENERLRLEGEQTRLEGEQALLLAQQTQRALELARAQADADNERLTRGRLEVELRALRAEQTVVELSSDVKAAVLSSWSATFAEADPGLSVLLAREAVRLAPSLLTHARLCDALTSCDEVCTVALPKSRVVALAFAPTLQEQPAAAAGWPRPWTRSARPGMLVAQSDGTVSVWGGDGALVSSWKAGDGLRGAWLEARGPRVYTLRGEATVESWDMDGQREQVHPNPEASGRKLQALGQAEDGRLVYALVGEGGSSLVDGDGQAILDLPPGARFALAPDGGRLLVMETLADQTKLRLVALDGTSLGRLDEPLPKAVRASFSPSSDVVVVKRQGRAAPGTWSQAIWSGGSNHFDAVLSDPDRVILDVALADRQVLMAGAEAVLWTSWDTEIPMYVQDRETARPQLGEGRSFLGHAGQVRLGVIAAGGEFLLTTGDDHSLKLWSEAGWGGVGSPRAEGWINDVSATSDGRGLTTLSMVNGTPEVCVLDVATGGRVLLASQVPSPVETVDRAGRSGGVLTRHQDGTLRIWAEDGEFRRLVEPGPTVRAAVLLEGDAVAFTLADGTVHIQPVAGERLTFQHVSVPLKLERSPQGDSFVSFGSAIAGPAASGGTACGGAGKSCGGAEPQVPPSAPSAPVIPPGPSNERLVLWSSTGKRIWSVGIGDRELRSLSYSEDGRRVAAHAGATLWLVDVVTGEHETPLPPRFALAGFAWDGQVPCFFERGPSGIVLHRGKVGQAQPVTMPLFTARSLAPGEETGGPCAPPAAVSISGAEAEEGVVPSALLAWGGGHALLELRPALYVVVRLGDAQVIQALRTPHCQTLDHAALPASGDRIFFVEGGGVRVLPLDPGTLDDCAERWLHRTFSQEEQAYFGALLPAKPAR